MKRFDADRLGLIGRLTWSSRWPTRAAVKKAHCCSGQSVDVQNGMIFNVKATDKS